MKTRKSLFLVLCLFFTIKGFGQQTDTDDNFNLNYHKLHRFYPGSGLDFAMLSTAFVSRPGQAQKLAVPRFTALVNVGLHLHYDFSKSFGIVSGLNVRNMGFIEKTDDFSIIRRVYSLGIPAGFKIGDLRNRNFLFGGGGIDIPFNYREKVFKKRGDKEKFNEWFSNRTPKLMPFAYVGYSFDPGITLKLQYYPGNFLNPDFQMRDLNGNLYQPYEGYKVHLLLFSFGFDIHYNQYRIQQREYLRMKREREKKTF